MALNPDTSRNLKQLMALSDQLPYTLALPFRKAMECVEEGVYSRALGFMLDFYEISTQYASSILLRLLIDRGAVEAVKPVLNKIDAKRPLSFGDCMVDILTPLMVACRKLIPDHPIVKGLTDALMVRKINILLGYKDMRSIVQIRNQTRGHSTTLSEKLYCEFCNELQPRMFKFLDGFAPLARYKAYGKVGEELVFRFQGPGMPIHEPRAMADGLPQHYYLEGPDETIDLFPLVFVNKDVYVYVFQTLDGDRISYVSSNLDAIQLKTEENNADFDRLMQKVLPTFDINRSLNWHEAKEGLWSVSREYLERVYKEKKYNQELFVERKAATAHLHDFIDSEATFYPLLGEAGQGKTCQLCNWTERLMTADEAVIIFNSSGFANTNLDDCLRTCLGFSSRKQMDKILSEIHTLAENAGKRIYFFFDAINECFHYSSEEFDPNAPLLLYRDILSRLISPEYPRFKVVATCRNYTWNELLKKEPVADKHLIFNADNDEKYHLHGFTSEEVAMAYDIYGPLYQMSTPFDEVSVTAKVRLKDPLVMKFACTNSLGKSLSHDISQYTTIALFDKMVDDIRTSYAGRMQYEIIKAIGQYMWGRYKEGKPVDSISVKDLRTAFDDPQSDLHRLSHLIYKKNGGLTVAYTELLNKPERPVLREGTSIAATDTKIQFVYERFLEYVLATAITTPDNPLGKDEYIELLRKNKGNEVLMSSLRNRMLIDYAHSRDTSTLISLILDKDSGYLGKQLVNEVINTLIKEDYEAELFALEDRLLSAPDKAETVLITEYNAVIGKIESNKADADIIKRHRELSAQLHDIMSLRRTACISIINGILLTDYFNQKLYTRNPLELLWKLIEDDITEVRNDASTYIYYLDNKRLTGQGSPITESLTEQIAREMLNIVESRTLIGSVATKQNRRRTLTFIETSVRLLTLMIIDATMTSRDRDRVGAMLGDITKLMKYCTYNFALVRLVLPFFQYILRKQITFQSDYVNNAIEYGSFWEGEPVPDKAETGRWSKEAFREALSFMSHHQMYGGNRHSEDRRKETERFKALLPAIESAYMTGDSFSYFALERILVIMGTTEQSNILPMIEGLFANEAFRRSEWFDYSQMSLLYVLYQVAVNSPTPERRILEIFERECRDWTLRNRGIYKARKSHKANPKGVYKRNLLNWYCIVYCSLTAEGTALEGDERCSPLVYELIDQAFETKDKELLYHIIESVTELITDNGLYTTALDIVHYMLSKIDSHEIIDAIDSAECSRDGIYEKPVVEVINTLFSTAKNYCATNVNHFIHNRLSSLTYPGANALKGDILQFNPAGEKFSDLLTHKFGNFLMWSLLNEEAVDNFATEAMTVAVHSKDCYQWYDNVVRILFRHMFKIKL